MEKVSVVECPDYDDKRVEDAVAKCFELIGFNLEQNSKVMLKPNIVGTYPKNQEAITTHLSVIRGVCEFLKKQDCEIFIGDSSFVNTSQHMKKLGLDVLAEKYGKLIIFDAEELVEVEDANSSFISRVQIPKILKEMDYIINLPKLKTHVLTMLSGAVKNMYGCIPGGMKQTYHNTARGYENFSKLAVDLYQKVIPNVNLMDGIIGMEGPGSTAGYPKKSGLLLASKNGVALDIASSKIIGLDPKEVIMLDEAIKRRLYDGWEFELVGMEKLPSVEFQKPLDTEVSKGFSKVFPNRKVICDEEKCIKCGICARKCPVNAIRMEPYPIIDHEKCIKCFCCAEVCPQHAIEVENPQSTMRDIAKKDKE